MVDTIKSSAHPYELVNPADRRWLALHGEAHCNRIFRGQEAFADYVLVHKNPEPFPGRDVWQECSILEAIQGYRWAPELVACDPSAGIFVYPFYPSVEEGCILPRLLLDVLQDLEHIREGPVQAYADLLAHYRRLLPSTAAVQATLFEFESLIDWLMCGERCLVHHDLHRANFRYGGGSEGEPVLRVLDWEYAGLGNPWLDRSALLTHGLLTVDDLRLLPSLANLSLPTILDNLAIAHRIRTVLDQLWSWRQAMFS